jgi:hypothetical protein
MASTLVIGTVAGGGGEGFQILSGSLPVGCTVEIHDSEHLTDLPEPFADSLPVDAQGNRYQLFSFTF